MVEDPPPPVAEPGASPAAKAGPAATVRPWLLGLALAGAVAFDALSGGSDRGWAKPGAFALLGVAAAAAVLLAAFGLRRLAGAGRRARD